MKILVTGGAGIVGKGTVRHLVQRGHEVTVVGRSEGVTIDGASYRRCDITDYESIAAAVQGMEAVVHLAAVPNPHQEPGHVLFSINCGGTYNVFAAAAAAGIKRVVCASSINALGATFGIKPVPIKYFPIDEDHPTFTTDPYSFSKGVMEETAAYFWRREGISSVCLRIPAVRGAGRGWHPGPWHDHSAGELRAVFAEVAGASPELRNEWVERHRRRYEEWRKLAHHERERHRHHMHHWWRQPLDAERLFMHLRREATDFWALVDEQDCARAIELGLTAAYEGSHALFINDNRNAVGADAEVLARLFYPEVTERKRPLVGDEALVSTERARKLIGFVPQHPVPQLLGKPEPQAAARA